MRYSIFINQEMAMAFRINLSEATVFSLLYDAANWATQIRMKCAGTRKEETFYFVSRNLIAEQLPILQAKSTDTIYRHLKSLAEKGLIFYQKKGRRDCIRLTPEGKKWNISKLGNKSEFEDDPHLTPSGSVDNQSITSPEKTDLSNSEINPSLTDSLQKLGNKSELQEKTVANSEINPNQLGNKSESNSEIFPTNKRVKEYKNIRILESSPEKNNSVNENKKHFSAGAENFPPALANYLDVHSAPAEIWNMFSNLLDWAHKKQIFIDWHTEDNFQANRRAAMRLFSLIRHQMSEEVSYDEVNNALRHFLHHLPEWHVSRFSLQLINSQFQSIINEQSKKSSGSSRSLGQTGPANPDKYREAAEAARKGKIFFE